MKRLLRLYYQSETLVNECPKKETTTNERI